MRRRFRLWLVLAAVLVAAPSFAISIGTAPPTGPFAFVAQPSVTCSGTGACASTTTTTGLGNARWLYCLLNVTAPSGTSPTLDVYLQSSPDGGTTWDDYALFNRVTVAGKTVLQLSTFTTPGAANHGVCDAGTCQLSGPALSAGTTRGGLWGPQVRVKSVLGGTTPSFTYSVNCVGSGD